MVRKKNKNKKERMCIIELVDRFIDTPNLGKVTTFNTLNDYNECCCMYCVYRTIFVQAS